MNREDYVHLRGDRENSPCRLRTFWCKRISLISLIPYNGSYNDSLYVLHNTLILAVRLT